MDAPNINNILYSQQDLKSYSRKELYLLGKYLGLPADTNTDVNVNDLRWLIALRLLNNYQSANFTAADLEQMRRDPSSLVSQLPQDVTGLVSEYVNNVRIVIGDLPDARTIFDGITIDIAADLNKAVQTGLFFILYQSSPIHIGLADEYFRIVYDVEGDEYLKPINTRDIVDIYMHSSENPNNGESLKKFLQRANLKLVDNDDLEPNVDIDNDDGENYSMVKPAKSINPDHKYAVYLSQLNHEDDIPPNNMLLSFSDPAVLNGIKLGNRLLGLDSKEAVSGFWVDGKWTVF